jgi:hypothetical protein
MAKVSVNSDTLLHYHVNSMYIKLTPWCDQHYDVPFTYAFRSGSVKSSCGMATIHSFGTTY